MKQRYISVRGWRAFQHYDPAKRTPPWIKQYTELLHDDAYMALPVGTALVLHRLWLEYASSRCRLVADTASLTRRLGVRVTMPQLKSLKAAGYIDLVASAKLADGYHSATPEVEVEVKVETENNVVEDDEDQSKTLGFELRELGLTPSQATLYLHEDPAWVRRVITYAKANGDNPPALALSMLRKRQEPPSVNGRREPKQDKTPEEMFSTIANYVLHEGTNYRWDEVEEDCEHRFPYYWPKLDEPERQRLRTQHAEAKGLRAAA
jgi:hypothetical protein